MPDYTAPEYASYVALMAEHPQEHKFRNGDWFWWPGGGSGEPLRPTTWEEGAYLYQDIADDEGFAPHVDFTARYIWLPQLADWLSLLEACHVYAVELGRAATGCTAWTDASEDQELQRRVDSLGEFPTREEAAAKLWMAVTGK